MNKLAIILPFYKRTELTKLCFSRLEEQSKRFGVDVFVAGDNESIVPKSFCFVPCDNLPLGNKLNTLLSQTKAYDGVMILGSDDFVSDSVFELYQTIDTTKEVFYGFDNCHVYSVWHNKLGTDLAYSKSGNTIGVARLWTKPTLEKMNYKLYTSTRNKGLDSDSKRNMSTKGINEFSLSYNGHFIVDVKQDLNITDPALINTCDTIHDSNMLVAEFGKIGNDILDLKVGNTKTINNRTIQRIKRVRK